MANDDLDLIRLFGLSPEEASGLGLDPSERLPAPKGAAVSFSFAEDVMEGRGWIRAFPYNPHHPYDPSPARFLRSKQMTARSARMTPFLAFTSASA